jgi:hypothetical protein
MKRSLKKSPWTGSRMNTTLSEDGMHITSDKSDVFLKWSAFTKALRFNDGFLLFQGPRVFNWLPKSALTEGSEQDVDSLLKENIKNYK